MAVHTISGLYLLGLIPTKKFLIKKIVNSRSSKIHNSRIFKHPKMTRSTIYIDSSMYNGWSPVRFFSGSAPVYNILPPFSCLREKRDNQFVGDILFLLGPSEHLHKTFNQSCFNVRPASPSLAHHWETNSSNNFHRVCWVHSQRLRLSWRCRWRNFAALREGLYN